MANKKSEKMVVIPDRLNCRKKPDMTGAVVAIFEKGQKLDLMAKTNKDWYKVTGLYQNKSITGYCMSKYLKQEG